MRPIVAAPDTPPDRGAAVILEKEGMPSGGIEMYGKIQIRNCERGLWFRGNEYHELLGPGVYQFVSNQWDAARDFVEVVNIARDTKFEHPRLDSMLHDTVMRDALEIVEVGPGRRALVWKGERLGWNVGPGRHAFWRDPYPLRVEIVDVGRSRVDLPKPGASLRIAPARRRPLGVG
ncbi:MAG: hypothetical protein BIFFINMI_00261 [Phycisphaerae bacterium]|nr:hypothetical protein [Phycisphaerae bacterium]